MRIFFVLLAFFLAPGWAPAPADCPTRPAVPGDTLPLELDVPLPRRPGMPNGGYVRLGTDQATAYGTVCEPRAPELPRDVLHGDTSTDVLSGRPRGNVNAR